MTLHADHALAGGEGQEFILQFLILGLEDEGDVHAGTAVLLGSADEEFVAVDFTIYDFGTLDGHLLHGSHTTLLLDPLEILQCAVDGHGGRSIEHTALADVCLVVEHGGDGTTDLAHDVLLDDDEGDAGHGEVLLGTTVDETVLAHVDGTGEDVGTHISHHRHGAVVVLQDLGAVDGVIRGDVEVIGVRGNGEFLGDVGEVLVLAGSYLHDLAEELCFLLSLGSPDTRVEVGRLLLEEVVGDHAELQACTATEEQHAVTFGDVQ